jgi:hypothetical protein
VWRYMGRRPHSVIEKTMSNMPAMMCVQRKGQRRVARVPLSKREAMATPPAFRDMLLSLALGARGY